MERQLDATTPQRSLEGRRVGFCHGPPLFLEQDLDYGGRSSGLEARSPGQASQER